MDQKDEPTHRSPPESRRETVRHLGPGLIVTACIVGSGELIATTKLGADAGFVLLWLILLGCLVKVFVQIELGRYAITSGKSTLEAMDIIPGPRIIVSWLVWFWLIMYVAVAFQVAGIAGGVAKVFTSLGFGWDDTAWVIIVSVSCAILLVVGRYRLVEVLSVGMVALFTVCTVVAAVSLQFTPYRITSEQILSGFRFSLPTESIAIAFAAFGITGVGATELIYYPYWCLEKGYGRYVGPRDDTPEWEARARGWIRVMSIDAWLSLVVYTVATVAFYLLGAAILHAQSLTVESSDLIATLSQMYEKTFGEGGAWIFLIGAFFVLYSTFFVGTASNARLFADGLSLFRVMRYPDSASRHRMVQVGSILIPISAAAIFIFFGDAVGLVLIGAFAQAMMLPFLGGLAIYLSLRRLPAKLRPNRVWILFLCVAFASMAILVLYQLVDENSKVRKFLSSIGSLFG